VQRIKEIAQHRKIIRDKPVLVWRDNVDGIVKHRTP